MQKFPVKVYFPRDKGEPKMLTARNDDELQGLLRVGWKLKAE